MACLHNSAVPPCFLPHCCDTYWCTQLEYIMQQQSLAKKAQVRGAACTLLGCNKSITGGHACGDAMRFTCYWLQ